MAVKRVVARPVRANVGTRVRYRRQMLALIKRMADSVERWCIAVRKSNAPEMASDATPSEMALRDFNVVADVWRKRFDDMAPTVADIFVRNQFRGTESAMREALRASGWLVQFHLTPAVRDAFDATVAENVGLIRSIAEHYLNEVQGIVARNYASGRNVRQMAKELHERLHVASNRAWLIARDQSNKANAVCERARRKELGIKEAIWMHSHAGVKPRPSHVAMNGKRFSVEKGMWDADAGLWIQPGELINCRCVSRSVLPFAPAPRA